VTKAVLANIQMEGDFLLFLGLLGLVAFLIHLTDYVLNKRPNQKIIKLDLASELYNFWFKFWRYCSISQIFSKDGVISPFFSNNGVISRSDKSRNKDTNVYNQSGTACLETGSCGLTIQTCKTMALKEYMLFVRNH